MKILYAIQGTGNGHISRAGDIIPILEQKGIVDVLISGQQAEIDLPYPVKFRLRGLSFVFGQKGGIDYVKTYKNSSLKQFFKEINSLPVEEYDLVISDFEPVSAWACYVKGKYCVGLSHQIAVTNSSAPKPLKTDLLGKAVLKYYAPVSRGYGLHFLAYSHHIFTPVIRHEVRELKPSNKGHYTVYLSAYSDQKIIDLLLHFPEVKWQVFSKHSKESYEVKHIAGQPVNNRAFLNSVATAEGVLCGAGFETPAEVLFLKKKLMVVPMKGQYEQQCNAAALKALGIPVIKNLNAKQVKKIHKWIQEEFCIHLSYSNETEDIINLIWREYTSLNKPVVPNRKAIYTPAKFRQVILKNIFNPS